jgi:hypothetical protein
MIPTTTQVYCALAQKQQDFTPGSADYPISQFLRKIYALLIIQTIHHSLETKESGRNRVLGGVVDLRIDCWMESWVPFSECILPLLVEYAGSNLEQKMCSALAPPHLLAFHHPLADNLIDG